MKVTSDQLKKCIEKLPDWDKFLRSGCREMRFPIFKQLKLFVQEMEEPVETIYYLVFEIDIELRGWVLKGFEVN